MSLVEAVEHIGAMFGRNANAMIGDADFEPVRGRLMGSNINATAIGTKFNCIEQHVC